LGVDPAAPWFTRRCNRRWDSHSRSYAILRRAVTISAQHTEADIEKHLAAFEDVAPALAKAQEDHIVEGMGRWATSAMSRSSFFNAETTRIRVADHNLELAPWTSNLKCPRKFPDDALVRPDTTAVLIVAEGRTSPQGMNLRNKLVWKDQSRIPADRNLASAKHAFHTENNQTRALRSFLVSSHLAAAFC
jgi:hypothetical protein